MRTLDLAAILDAAERAGELASQMRALTVAHAAGMSGAPSSDVDTH